MAMSSNARRTVTIPSSAIATNNNPSSTNIISGSSTNNLISTAPASQSQPRSALSSYDSTPAPSIKDYSIHKQPEHEHEHESEDPHSHPHLHFHEHGLGYGHGYVEDDGATTAEGPMSLSALTINDDAAVTEDKEGEAALHDSAKHDPSRNRQNSSRKKRFLQRGNSQSDNAMPSTSTSPSNSSSPHDEQQLPDGGLRAWFIILALTLISFTAFGQVLTFGTYQTFLSSHQLSHKSEFQISWIGSLQLSIIYFLSAFFGKLFDVYGAKPLLFIGMLLQLGGMLWQAFATEYWEFMVSQGVLLGTGIGLQFLPLLVVPAQWFLKRRSLAVGIVVAGSSLGGVVFPIILSHLFSRTSYKISIVVVLVITVSIQTVCTFFVQDRFKDGRSNFKDKDFEFFAINYKALGETKFLLHSLAGALIAFGLYTPVWYIQLFAQHVGLSPKLTFYVIPIVNASGAIGRISSGYLADKIGRFGVLTFIAFLQALACFLLWRYAQNVPALTIVFAIIFGCLSSSWNSIATSSLPQITPKGRVLGGRLGIFFLMLFPGVLAGPPIAGVFLGLSRPAKSFTQQDGVSGSTTSVESQTGDMKGWINVTLFCGAVLIAGAILNLVLWLILWKEAKAKKKMEEMQGRDEEKAIGGRTNGHERARNGPYGQGNGHRNGIRLGFDHGLGLQVPGRTANGDNSDYAPTPVESLGSSSLSRSRIYTLTKKLGLGIGQIR